MSNIIKDSKSNITIIHGYIDDEIEKLSEEEIEERLISGKIKFIPKLLSKLLGGDEVHHENGYDWCYRPNDGNLKKFAKFCGFEDIISMAEAKRMNLDIEEGYSDDFEYYKGFTNASNHGDFKSYYILTNDNKRFIRSQDPLFRYGSDEGIYTLNKEQIVREINDAIEVYIDEISENWNTYSPLFE